MSKLLLTIISLRGAITCIALLLIIISAIVVCLHHHEDGKTGDDCPLCRFKFFCNNYLIDKNTFIKSFENLLTCSIIQKENRYSSCIFFTSHPNAPPYFPA